MDYLYVYCITENLDKDGLITVNKTVIGGSNVDLIEYEGIQGIFNYVPEEMFNEDMIKEKLQDFDWVKTVGIAHENIIEEVMGKSSVIPMKFCTIFLNKANLMEFIKEYYVNLKETLKVAKFNDEWTVKVIFDKDIVRNNIISNNIFKEKLGRIENMSQGTAFLLKKKFDEEVNSSIIENIDYFKGKIIKEIEETGEAIVKKSKLLEGNFENIIYNICLLINKEDGIILKTKIKELTDDYKDNGYMFKLTGPWPIYNFIDL